LGADDWAQAARLNPSIQTPIPTIRFIVFSHVKELDGRLLITCAVRLIPTSGGVLTVEVVDLEGLRRRKSEHHYIAHPDFTGVAR
jgi:hypothetical protein